LHKGSEKARNQDAQGAPKVLIVGTGAVGGFYGGRLALARARVATLCRSDYETVRSQGIMVKRVWGDFQFTPEKVIRRAAEYGPPPDYILVALKVLPGVDPVEIIRDAVGPETAIILVQNGIGIDGPVAAAFPRNEVIGAVAFIAVSRTGDSWIIQRPFSRKGYQHEQSHSLHPCSSLERRRGGFRQAERAHDDRQRIRWED